MWTVELLDDYEDVQTAELHYTLKDAMQSFAMHSAESSYHRVDFGLVKLIIGAFGEGVVERGHAYMRDGELEAEFDSVCHKVPVRFIRQFERAWQRFKTA